jgi:hypothetical protein
VLQDGQNNVFGDKKCMHVAMLKINCNITKSDLYILLGTDFLFQIDSKHYTKSFFLVVKSPAADATDAPEP